MGAVSKKDFFISYNQADEDAAQWIAWTLEAAGYLVVIEAWDFNAGGNFVVEMDRALVQCERMIAVISPHYLSANYTVPEWAEKFANDPKGLHRSVVPVVVEPCEPSGLLQALIRIDITGLDRNAAKKELLAKLVPGRSKPATEPPFPQRITSYAATPGSGATPTLRWSRLTDDVRIRWRTDQHDVRNTQSTLELHTICVGGTAIESRSLRDLTDTLTNVGRLAGLFEQSEGVRSALGEDYATAVSSEPHGARGITVLRDREIISWTPLPRDLLGSVFDEDDVKRRLSALLGLHLMTDLIDSDQVALGVAVEPVTSLVIGSAGDVNNRNSAQFLFTGSATTGARVSPREGVTLETLTAFTDDVAEELTAKLALRIAAMR